MKKIVLLLLFFILSLTARENPFSPQKVVEEPKIILPKLEIQKPIKPIKIEVVKKAEPKKVPMKIPEIMIEKTIPIVVEKPIIKRKKKKIRKIVPKSKLIYNGKFTKIKLFSNSIRIITKDQMLEHIKLIHPNRLAIDFERFDVVRPFSKKVYSSYVKHLKIGHHGYFYRATFTLRKNYQYKIRKKSYGYLIKLY